MTTNETFHDVLARVQRQRDAFEAAYTVLRRTQGKGEAADGKVTAMVDSSGALVSLVIDESLTQLPPRELARNILEAAQKASFASDSARRAAYHGLTSALRAHTG